ncbi:uncharacterized protein LOC121764064 [Salvia splendens]|uniref:uncharacterized protein LOC121764064 n=1 Tax=Salvia splendens TaxID=180675 RepID=UPI001C264BC5|nr:uncharacterized protein LOC121764064 [Salvia splendens]
MALTNFILTVAGVSAVVLLLRSDVKQSATIFRRNVRQIRNWLEEESSSAANCNLGNREEEKPLIWQRKWRYAVEKCNLFSNLVEFWIVTALGDRHWLVVVFIGVMVVYTGIGFKSDLMIDYWQADNDDEFICRTTKIGAF